jgi:hypothetical protein
MERAAEAAPAVSLKRCAKRYLAPAFALQTTEHYRNRRNTTYLGQRRARYGLSPWEEEIGPSPLR